MLINSNNFSWRNTPTGRPLPGFYHFDHDVLTIVFNTGGSGEMAGNGFRFIVSLVDRGDILHLSFWENTLFV